MSIRTLIGNLVAWPLVMCYPLTSRFKPERQVLSLYMHNPNAQVVHDTLTYLKRQGFTFVSTQTLAELLARKESLQQKTAVLTLDDAWQGNLTKVIPIIEEMDVPVTIFAPIQPMEEGVMWLKYFRDKDIQEKYAEVKGINPKQITTTSRNKMLNKIKGDKTFEREIMTTEELKILAQHPLVNIGGHTNTHPILTQCNDEELHDEIVDAKRQLETLVGCTINVMAYPNGDYSTPVMNIVSEAGYLLAFTTQEGKTIDIMDSDTLALPRNCVPNAFGKYESIARALGLWQHIFKA